jgi:hypothetical protein
MEARETMDNESVSHKWEDEVQIFFSFLRRGFSALYDLYGKRTEFLPKDEVEA